MRPVVLAITAQELEELRRHRDEQVSREAQAFGQDYRNERQKMAQREREFAEHLRETESRRAEELLEKRKPFRKTDWTNPPRDFEAEAVGKLHDQNLKKLNRQFSPEVFLDRLFPHLRDFASSVVLFERRVLPGIPPSKRHAHIKRILAAVLEMIFPRVPREDPLPPQAAYVRVSEEKKWKGKVIAGPYEVLLNKQRRPLGWRRALSAERRGEFEHLPIGDLWGLLRVFKKKRSHLRQMLKDGVLSDLVQIAEDKRDRPQMVEDCKKTHGVTDKVIALTARVSLPDFYQWRANNSKIGPKKTRRILFVILSPTWPPPQLPAEF